MSLLMLEGVNDRLANSGKYWLGFDPATRTVSSPTRTGTGIAVNSLANPEWRALPTEEHATLIAGAAFYWGGGNGQRIFTFKSDAGITSHTTLHIMGSGQLQARRGDGTVLATSTYAQPMTPNVWHYIEFKATLHDTTGSVYARVDEVQVIAATGLDTKNGGTKTVYDQVKFNEDQGSTWADAYVCNAAGTLNNDFMGDIIVETLLPTGNGTTSVLVGSDGNSVNNYALVNEATPDTTTYVGSATNGDKDTYAFGDLAHTSGAILGVVVSIVAAKSDAGARTAREVIRSAGTDYPSASDKALSTTYTAYKEVHEVDPATGAAWTIAAVNAAEPGFEVRP
jgi:hypothetical protein